VRWDIDISGMVGVFADNSPQDDWTKLKPLKGVAVSVIDTSGQIHSAVTDDEGVYIFPWPPPALTAWKRPYLLDCSNGRGRVTSLGL
jgi:hypothetical protein